MVPKSVLAALLLDQVGSHLPPAAASQGQCDDVLLAMLPPKPPRWVVQQVLNALTLPRRPDNAVHALTPGCYVLMYRERARKERGAGGLCARVLHRSAPLLLPRHAGVHARHVSPRAKKPAAFLRMLQLLL